MQRKTLLFALLAVCTVAAVACSGTAPSPVSPSALLGGSSALNPDGSNLKVTAPGSLSPDGGTVDTVRPTLSFANAVGRFAPVGLAYEIEVNAGGDLVYSRVIGESPNSSSHQLDSDLAHATDHQWRVRGRLGNDVGPWSNSATFRTPDRPGPPPPPPGGGLPFPVPEACLAGNGPGCVFAIAAQSTEWRRCASADGVGCHRFTRQVAFALSRSDPNWQMIIAAPGGHACNCFVCGSSDGTMFREDALVYGGRTVFDIIVGAGGPSPSPSWGVVPGPRPGDFPGDAPICVP